MQRFSMTHMGIAESRRPYRISGAKNKEMRWKFLLLALVVVLIGIAVHAQASIAARSAAMVLYFMPERFPQPLDRLGADVTIEHTSFVDRNGRTIPLTYYLPRTPGRHPAILVVHGWIPGGDQA